MATRPWISRRIGCDAESRPRTDERPLLADLQNDGPILRQLTLGRKPTQEGRCLTPGRT